MKITKFELFKKFNFLLSGTVVFAVLLIILSFKGFNGVLYDIIRTIFTSFSMLLAVEAISRVNLKKHLIILNGQWDGFQIGNPDVLDSNAVIMYKGDNLLRVFVTMTNGKKWNGMIEINERVLSKHGIRGILVYKYDNTEEAGYREVLILKVNDDYQIYTFPTTSMDASIHGKEIFKRKNYTA